MMGQAGSERAAEDILNYIRNGKLEEDLGRKLTAAEFVLLTLVTDYALEIREAARGGWY